MLVVVDCIIQCRRQARTNLEPEFCQFMTDTADHLEQLYKALKLCRSGAFLVKWAGDEAAFEAVNYALRKAEKG